jgi:hypothetical protein
MVGNALFPRFATYHPFSAVETESHSDTCDMRLCSKFEGEVGDRKVEKGGSEPTHREASPLPDWLDYLMNDDDLHQQARTKNISG